ncbi:hypothetical protein TYRP_021056, partial [Tyrophagus putrescentiae]
KFFSDFQSSKLSETEALELAIQTSIAEYPQNGDFSHSDSSATLDSSNRTSLADSYSDFEEEEEGGGDENNNMAAKHRQQHGQRSSASSSSSSTASSSKGGYQQGRTLATNGHGGGGGKKESNHRNGEQTKGKRKPSKKPKAEKKDSGRLAGPLAKAPKQLEQSSTRFCAARKFATNDYLASLGPSPKLYPPSAYHITNPNEPIIISSSTSASALNPHALKISTRENRQRIDKCFRNFSLFPQHAIFGRDFKTFLLMAQPKMLYNGGDLVASFPVRMSLEQFEFQFKADQLKIRQQEAKARARGEAEVVDLVASGIEFGVGNRHHQLYAEDDVERTWTTPAMRWKWMEAVSSATSKMAVLVVVVVTVDLLLRPAPVD